MEKLFRIYNTIWNFLYVELSARKNSAFNLHIEAMQPSSLPILSITNQPFPTMANIGFSNRAHNQMLNNVIDVDRC